MAPLDTQQSETPLMALVDAALSDGESLSSSSRPESPSGEVAQVSKPSDRKNVPLEKLSFAQQLMTLLDDETSPYLSWMPNGKSFTIKNPKKFASDEMPKLFNIRNMSSFVRKLSRWGFNRYHEKETMNSDLFRHQDFQRGEWKKCCEIKCSGRHPVTSILRKESPNVSKKLGAAPKLPGNVYLPNTSAHMNSDVNDIGNPLLLNSLFDQPKAPAPSSITSVLADAALRSFALERSVDPETRAKLFALQFIQGASQQAAHQEQLSQQHLLHSWLTPSTADINHRLALAASFGNFASSL